MVHIRRNISIRRGDVGGRPITLLLCFQVSSLENSQFPVAWKVVTFSGDDHVPETLFAAYQNQFFVADPEIGLHDKIGIGHNKWIKTKSGRKVTLQQLDSSSVVLKKSGWDLIVVDNKTNSTRDVTIGIHEDENPTPLLYLPGLQQNHSVEVEFTGILHAYVLEPQSIYEAHSILRGTKIESIKPFWIKDIILLGEDTRLIFKYDPVTKVPRLEPDHDKDI